jgi:hypothetical protein
VKTRTEISDYCPACGTSVGHGITSCNICGKLLQEGYFPLDNLKASYRKRLWQSEDRHETSVLYEENKNGASETAWAFTVYSLVPYIGILFCPGAVLMGGIGMLVSYRKPKLGGARMSVISIAGGFLVLGLQVFLWWLLYYIPTLNRHF